MIRKDTWFLIALAMIALVYTLAFERGGPSVPKAMPLLLPKFKPEAITGIQILSHGTNALHVVRAEDRWRLIHPIRYPADPVRPEIFLKAMATLQPLRHIPVKNETGKYHEFGLDSPRLVFRFHTKGQPLELHFGDFTPLADKIYVRRPNQPGVFLLPKNSLPENFQALLPRMANLWRDHSLFQLGDRLLDVDMLTIRSGPRQMMIRRNATNRLWQIRLPAPVKRAHQDRIREALANISQWRVAVDGFVTDDHQGDHEPYGLQAPTAEISLGNGTNLIATVQFGHSPTNQPQHVYARILSHTNIVRVPKPLLDFLRAPVWDFCDHRLGSPIGPSELARIEVQAGENFALTQSTNGVWRISAPNSLPADEALVIDLFRNLQLMKALELKRELVADFSQFGLAKPSASYTLRTRGGPNQIHTQITFGTPANTAGDRLHVRRWDRNFLHDKDTVYVVANPSRQSLPSYSYELRERKFWNFAPNEVTKITIEDGPKATILQRNDTDQWTGPGGRLTPTEVNLVELALKNLGQFKVVDWTTRGADKLAGFEILSKKKSLTLELVRGDKSLTRKIQFGRKSEKGNTYAFATDPLDQEPVVFEFPGNTMQACEIGLFPLAMQPPEK
jgi:hypothetical protein